MSYALHYYPGNASLLPHMMLREIGVPFELRLVDRNVGAQRSAEYLRLNPNGRIPVLTDGNATLYETAAIALYLTERHPEAALAPAPDARGRPDFLRWMVHFTNTPQTEFRAWFYPEEHVADAEAAPSVKRAAEARLGEMFERIAAQLGAGPWLLGEAFSAADLFLFMLIRWGRTLSRPVREVPGLGALAERVVQRPAVQATLRAEKLGAPFY